MTKEQTNTLLLFASTLGTALWNLCDLQSKSNPLAEKSPSNVPRSKPTKKHLTSLPVMLRGYNCGGCQPYFMTPVETGVIDKWEIESPVSPW